MPLIIKKVLRSMWRGKIAYLVCMTVIAVGIMCYVVLASVSTRLTTAKDAFYAEYNFADVFVRLTQAPESVVGEIERLEGVSAAEGRLSVSGRVITDEKDKIVTLRLYGIDTQTDMREQINGFKFSGSGITETREILLDKPFFEARGLKEGDSIEISISGTRTLFTVREHFNSPEYIYTISDSGSIMPEPDSFGIGLVSKETLENITGWKGVITDIGIILEEGYEFNQVKTRLEELFRSFGVVYLLPRKDQPSNQMLTMELDGITGMSTGMSSMFLMVAGAILYIMLTRLVEQERTQIGVLKAFGYSGSRILGNYLLYGIITGITGGIIGAALGVISSESMYNMYLTYFSIPPTDIPVSSGVYAYFAKGVFVSAAAGMGAAFLGVRKALGLKPAEAMRPPAPPLINNSVFDNNKLLQALLSKRGLMTLRYLERNKFKSALIVFSISLAYMLMAMMYSYSYMIDKMMIDQLTKVETYDMKVTLGSPVATSEALSGIRSVRGVSYAEAVLELSFTMTNENISTDAVISGLNQASPIYKIMDSNDVYHQPPTDGLMLTHKLAEKLNVSAGDTITIDSPYMRKKKDIRISKVIESSFGTGAYMEAEALSELIEAPPVANRVALTIEEGLGAHVKEELTSASNISQISDKEAILRSYDEITETYSSMIFTILAMAILIAFSIINNVSGVSLSERSRELATMRVLGYRPGETAEILSFENYLLCALAIIAGIPLTMLALKWYATAFDSDLFSFPKTLPPIAHLYSGLSCLLSVFLSNLAILKSVKKFELAVVLKERE